MVQPFKPKIARLHCVNKDGSADLYDRSTGERICSCVAGLQNPTGPAPARSRFASHLFLGIVEDWFRDRTREDALCLGLRPMANVM